MSAGPKGVPRQNARIGVLAVQGDFAEHAARLRALGCETIELRCAADLDTALDAIVLPGGESTVQADRKSTRLNSRHSGQSRMPSSA